MSVLASGDQHGGLAVSGMAKAHGCNLGLVGGRDGRVQHKTASNSVNMLQGGGWTLRKKKKLLLNHSYYTKKKHYWTEIQNSEIF